MQQLKLCDFNLEEILVVCDCVMISTYISRKLSMLIIRITVPDVVQENSTHEVTN